MTNDGSSLALMLALVNFDSKFRDRQCSSVANQMKV